MCLELFKHHSVEVRRIVLPAEGLTIIAPDVEMQEASGLPICQCGIHRWTGRPGAWVRQVRDCRSKAAKQEDGSFLSIRESRVYKFLLKLLMLKIFAGCLNNRLWKNGHLNPCNCVLRSPWLFPQIASVCPLLTFKFLL